MTIQTTLDIDAVAQVLVMSRSSIRRLWYAGLLPKPIRIGRRSIRWRVSDIDQFLANQPAASKPLKTKVPQ